MQTPISRTKLATAGALSTLAACLLASTPAAMAATTVTFVNPEKMTDVPRFERDREFMQAELQAHLESLAARLPAGQSLNIEVLDIDLAGDVFPRVAIRDVRVLKGQADWPHIRLRFRLEQDGKLISSGERHLMDMNYMMHSRRTSQENFPHEKKLLDDWFKKEIAPGRQAGG